MDFIVATGIECSAPIIAGGARRDELILTGHNERFEEDIAAVAGLGITHLRYGIPFHRVTHQDGVYDWAWTDRAMAAMQEHAVEPIVDLLHFGVPDRLSGFADPRLPAIFRDYVAAFADRFPWVRWYTPVNEPFISALFSGRNGWWNERGTTDAAFVAALDNTVTCAIEGMRVIRARRSDAIFLQSDACEGYTASDPNDHAAVGAARLLMERSWTAFDLTYGRPISEEMRAYLQRSGMSAARLGWFERNGTDEGCIVGLDYYEGNEHLVLPDGALVPAERRGFGALARQFHDRFGLPMMLAETNIPGDKAIPWLTEVWNDTVRLIDEGIPMVGFCWYSLTDQVDWDTCLREANDRVNPVGLVDLDRRRRPVAEVYAALAAASRIGGPSPLPDDDVLAA